MFSAQLRRQTYETAARLANLSSTHVLAGQTTRTQFQTSVDLLERFNSRDLPISAEFARNLQSFGECRLHRLRWPKYLNRAYEDQRVAPETIGLENGGPSAVPRDRGPHFDLTALQTRACTPTFVRKPAQRAASSSRTGRTEQSLNKRVAPQR